MEWTSVPYNAPAFASTLNPNVPDLYTPAQQGYGAPPQPSGFPFAPGYDAYGVAGQQYPQQQQHHHHMVAGGGGAPAGFPMQPAGMGTAPAQPQSQSSPPRGSQGPPPSRPVAGTKRHASDDLWREQPLAKRLELLSLRNAAPRKPLTPPTSPPAADNADAARMDVDGVVYVSTLSSPADSDAEDDPDIEEIPREKRGLVFLPDIEKRLTAIPERVLRPDAPTALVPGSSGWGGWTGPQKGGELVLWQKVPKMIGGTGGECDEGVRRAIFEARRRVREKAEREAAEESKGRVWELGDEDEVQFDPGPEIAVDEDPDAMDIE